MAVYVALTVTWLPDAPTDVNSCRCLENDLHTMQNTSGAAMQRGPPTISNGPPEIVRGVRWEALAHDPARKRSGNFL